MTKDRDAALKALGIITADVKVVDAIPEDTGVEINDDEEVWLKVDEFAYQDEVGKKPSQIYQWINKSDFPHRLSDKGTKEVPFYAGLKWIEERKTYTRVYQTKPGPKRFMGYTPKVGDYLKWDRENKLGFAYGRVYKLNKTLACIVVEYRTRPVYLPLDQLRRDVASGVVKVTNEVDVAAFLLQTVARIEFLVAIRHNVAKAHEVKQLLIDMQLVNTDRTERFYEHEFTKWPKEEDLVTEDG